MSDGLYSPHLILLVEDDALQREALVEMLVFMGHNVLPAANGEQALGLLKTNPISVLVTDVGLPGISGIELALRVAAHSPAVHVIFATGKPHLIDSPLPFDFSVLSKPFCYAALQEKLIYLHIKQPR